MGTDKGISRREALVRMGRIVAGTAAASIGLPALTSCAGKRRKRRIVLYFTATGNSLYVARQLAEPEGELLSIPQMVKQNRYEFEADEISIVYPIYGHMPPNMVRNFIREARLKAEYKFAVLTYGARKCDAAEIWNDLSAKAGNAFDYIATLVMVDNWLPNFDMNEQVKMDKRIPENLRRIAGEISRRRHWLEPVSEEERQMHAGFMAFSGLDPEVGFLKRSERYFTVTDACIGCGACTDVCPRGNYELTSHGVATQGDCDFCFACIQNCPQKAIRFRQDSGDPLLARGERNPDARYRNEHVSLMDIKRANSR